MNDLQIIGPKRHGLVNQFSTMAWKFLSKRFGMYGEAFKVAHSYSGENENDATRKAEVAGRKHHRRLEGKNGWLWYTIFNKMGRIHKLETDMEENHVRVPISPKWYHKLILKRMFGYEYAQKDQHADRWDD